MGLQGGLDGEHGLRFPRVHHLGEVSLFVGDVRDGLETSVGEQDEVAAVGVLSVAGLGVSVEAAVQGVANHVLEGVVGHRLCRGGERRGVI